MLLATETISSWPCESVGRWFVLRTRARQEKILARQLAAQTIANFVPLIRSVRYYGGQCVTVDVPLFPGYVFLRGDNDQAYTADRTRRVAQIIEVTDQARLDAELFNIHLALSHHAPLDPYPYLREGVRVEVRAGPYHGLRGIVQRRVGADRLVLQIHMLGQAVSLPVEPSLLDVVEDLAHASLA